MTITQAFKLLTGLLVAPTLVFGPYTFIVYSIFLMSTLPDRTSN